MSAQPQLSSRRNSPGAIVMQRKLDRTKRAERVRVAAARDVADAKTGKGECLLVDEVLFYQACDDPYHGPVPKGESLLQSAPVKYEHIDSNL